MQRSKAQAGVELKQVIGTLCKLLAATGLDAIPAPETFRRAKFGGGPEVEGQFWQLLVNILQRTGIVSSEAHLKDKGEYRKLVAAGLWQTGCHADWMHWGEVAQSEEEKHCSSRDLLLALGWLLAKGTLKKLVTQRVQQLDKTVLTSVPMNTLMVSHELQLDSASLQRLQWLIGYLRNQRQILLSMLDERSQLLHAVFSSCLHSAVSSSPDPSLTALNDDCDRMRQLCDLQEAYLSWKQVEKVFWTWMDNVMDCHLTYPVVKKSLHTPDVCHHRNQGLEKLEDIQSRLHTAQKRQRRGRGDTQEKGGERFQGGLGTSSLFCVPSQAYRLMLQVERPIYSAETFNGSSNTPDKIHVSQAAQLLLQKEALLLERRDRQRLANRMQLQKIICKVKGLVLIPP